MEITAWSALEPFKPTDNVEYNISGSSARDLKASPARILTRSSYGQCTDHSRGKYPNSPYATPGAEVYFVKIAS